MILVIQNRSRFSPMFLKTFCRMLPAIAPLSKGLPLSASASPLASPTIRTPRSPSPVTSVNLPGDSFSARRHPLQLGGNIFIDLVRKIGAEGDSHH